MLVSVIAVFRPNFGLLWSDLDDIGGNDSPEDPPPACRGLGPQDPPETPEKLKDRNLEMSKKSAFSNEC